MLLNAWFDERTGDNVTNRAGEGGGGALQALIQRFFITHAY